MILFIPHNSYYSHFLGEGTKVQRVPVLRSPLPNTKASVLNPVLRACMMH